jgi:hypothetical protein
MDEEIQIGVRKIKKQRERKFIITTFQLD